MSDEEKKIIETINDYIKKKEELCDLGDDFTINFRDTKPLKTLINLIEKQQNKIEERETRLQEEINENCKLKTELYGNSISKDKIREAIKNREIELYADNPENNFIPFDKVIDTLNDLLEEK